VTTCHIVTSHRDERLLRMSDERCSMFKLRKFLFCCFYILDNIEPRTFSFNEKEEFKGYHSVTEPLLIYYFIDEINMMKATFSLI